MATAAQKPEKVETDTKLCSKCKERPRAHPESTNPWCRQCNTAKQMEYQENREDINKARGYADGCASMRVFIAEYFKQFGNCQFSGFEVSVMTRKAGLPQ